MRLLQEKKQHKERSRRCILVWSPVWLEKNPSREVAGNVVGVGGQNQVPCCQIKYFPLNFEQKNEVLKAVPETARHQCLTWLEEETEAPQQLGES